MKLNFKKRTNQDISINGDVNDIVLYLNEKFPKLQEITDKFEGKIKKLEEDNPKKAFNPSSDPTLQLKVYEDFIAEYEESIKEIREKFNGINDASDLRVDEDLKKTKYLFNLTQKNTEKLKTLYINDKKFTIINTIKKMVETDHYEDIYSNKKKIGKIFHELKTLEKSYGVIAPKSLETDLNMMRRLIERKKFQKHSSGVLKAFVYLGIATIGTIIGVTIWILM